MDVGFEGILSVLPCLPRPEPKM